MGSFLIDYSNIPRAGMLRYSLHLILSRSPASTDYLTTYVISVMLKFANVLSCEKTSYSLTGSPRQYTDETLTLILIFDQ